MGDDDWDLDADAFDRIVADSQRQLETRRQARRGKEVEGAFASAPCRSGANGQSQQQQQQQNGWRTTSASSSRGPAANGHRGSQVRQNVRPSNAQAAPPMQQPPGGAATAGAAGAEGAGFYKTPVKVTLLLTRDGRVEAKFPYNKAVVDACKSIQGSAYLKDSRSWAFPFSKQEELINTLQSLSTAEVQLERVPAFVEKVFELASMASDDSERYLQLPLDLEAQLLPFQRDGVQFILKHGGRGLIGDEMGCGKTIQAVALACCYEDEWPLLLMVPGSLRMQWGTEFVDRIPSLLRSTDVRIVETASDCTLDGLVNIMSYDLVTKLSEEIQRRNFKVVIADESHYLKNRSAKRTEAALPILQKAKRVILLTGTPALARPLELFTQLSALHPKAFKNFNEYADRYCQGGTFGYGTGASNLRELHAMLESVFMVRRLKRDVLAQLPPKLRQQVYINIKRSSSDALQSIKKIFHDLDKLPKVALNTEGLDSASAPGESRNSSVHRQLLMDLYRATARAKVAAVQEYLETLLEGSDGKQLIFAHHQHMLDAIEETVQKHAKSGGKMKRDSVEYIRIDGSTPSGSRAALVQRFQSQPSCRVAVLAIKAAGAGITLTEASTVVFAEYSWTPGDIVQAEDRAHRIGQTDCVNVIYLHAKDTADDIIWRSIQNKLNNLGTVLNGQEAAADMKLAIEKPKAKAEPDQAKRPSLDLHPTSQQHASSPAGTQRSLAEFWSKSMQGSQSPSTRSQPHGTGSSVPEQVKAEDIQSPNFPHKR
eukprot:jgi/Chlat1/3767/Chrsp259S03908